MTNAELNQHLNEALLMAFEETFESVSGIFLDRGTSLFETLETISAEEASIPVSANCANIAAHVEHVSFYIETLFKRIEGDRSPVDWDYIWETVREVSPEAWASSQQRLRDNYSRIQEVVRTMKWAGPQEIGGALGLLAHTVYHLGEIRQALCTVKSGESSGG